MSCPTANSVKAARSTGAVPAPSGSSWKVPWEFCGRKNLTSGRRGAECLWAAPSSRSIFTLLTVAGTSFASTQLTDSAVSAVMAAYGTGGRMPAGVWGEATGDATGDPLGPVVPAEADGCVPWAAGWVVAHPADSRMAASGMMASDVRTIVMRGEP